MRKGDTSRLHRAMRLFEVGPAVSTVDVNVFVRHARQHLCKNVHLPSCVVISRTVMLQTIST